MRVSTRACGWIAATLLVLLGLARGIGGVLLLHGGPSVAGSDARPDAPAGLIGVGLILVGVLCLAGGAATILRARSALWVGGGALVIFVAGGVTNGILLYGGPRVGGVVGNVLYASLTSAALWLGTRRT